MNSNQSIQIPIDNEMIQLFTLFTQLSRVRFQTDLDHANTVLGIGFYE